MVVAGEREENDGRAVAEGKRKERESERDERRWKGWLEGGCRTLQGILRPRHYVEQMSNSLNPRVL